MKLGRKDLNFHEEIQKLRCYRYITSQEVQEAGIEPALCLKQIRVKAGRFYQQNQLLNETGLLGIEPRPFI